MGTQLRRARVIGAAFFVALSFATSAAFAKMPWEQGAPESDPTANAAEPGSVDALSGAVTTSFNFALERARGDVQPSLTLRYSSRDRVSHEGGVGWRLDIPTIEIRNLDGAPRYRFNPADVESSDRFAFDGAPLVFLGVAPAGGTLSSLSPELPALPIAPGMGGARVFQLANDTLHAIFFWSADGRTWTVRLFSGESMQFGAPTEGPAPSDEAVDVEPTTRGIFRWNLSRRWDSHGAAGSRHNLIVYQWAHLAAGAPAVLTDIYDTPAVGDTKTIATYLHHVHLSHRPLVAPHVTPVMWRAQNQFVIETVDVTARAITSEPQASMPTLGARELVRRYQLLYTADRRSAEHLTSVQLSGHCGRMREDARGVVRASTSCPAMPPTTFSYTSEPRAWNTVPVAVDAPKFKIFPDYDLIRRNPSVADDSPHAFQFVDLNGDGLPDMIGWYNKDDAGYRNVYINSLQPGSIKPKFTERRLRCELPRDDWNAVTSMEHYSATGPCVEFLTRRGPLTFRGDFFTNGNPSFFYLPIRMRPQRPTEPRVPLTAYIITQGAGILSDGSRFIDVTTAARTRGANDWIFRAEPLPMGPYTPPHFEERADPRRRSEPLPPTIADVDGDGLPDLVDYARGRVFRGRRHSGGTVTVLDGLSDAQSGRDEGAKLTGTWPMWLKDGAPFFADFDGDGLDDQFVRPMPEAIGSGEPNLDLLVCPNITVQADTIAFDKRNCITLFKNQAFRAKYWAVDLTGDGRADIVTNNYNGEPGLFVFVNVDGRGRLEQVKLDTSSIHPFYPTNFASRMTFADINGSGVTDLVIFTNTSAYYFDLAQPTPEPRHVRPWLLQTIDNGRGMTTRFTYETTTSLAARKGPAPGGGHLPLVTDVVTRVDRSITDARGTVASYTDYDYEDPAFDGVDRRFVGYRTVIAKTGFGGASERVVRTTNIVSDGTPLSALSILRRSPVRAVLGKPILVEVSDALGHRLSTTRYSYAIKPGAIRAREKSEAERSSFGYVRAVDTWLFDSTVGRVVDAEFESAANDDGSWRMSSRA